MNETRPIPPAAAAALDALCAIRDDEPDVAALLRAEAAAATLRATRPLYPPTVEPERTLDAASAIARAREALAVGVLEAVDAEEAVRFAAALGELNGEPVTAFPW